jgi:hypothetical protein
MELHRMKTKLYRDCVFLAFVAHWSLIERVLHHLSAAAHTPTPAFAVTHAVQAKEGRELPTLTVACVLTVVQDFSVNPALLWLQPRIKLAVQ